MYVSMGNECTNSNGHGEGKGDSMNLVETIKSIQKDVQSYKVDNEMLMKDKEKHEDFNIKIIQSLDRLTKNMDKETESSILTMNFADFLDDLGRHGTAHGHEMIVVETCMTPPDGPTGGGAIR
jgi:hypothetical protein